MLRMRARVGSCLTALTCVLCVGGLVAQGRAQDKPAGGAPPQAVDARVPSPARTDAAPAEATVAPKTPGSRELASDDHDSNGTQRDAPRRDAPQQDELADATHRDSGPADLEAVRSFLERHPELDCPVQSTWSSPARVWVACGPSGLLVLQRRADGFTLLEARSVEGEVMGFFVHGGRVWARVFEERALVVGRVNEASAEPAPRELPSGGVGSGAEIEVLEEHALPVDLVIGHVTKVNGLEVEIDVGSADGISMGARIAFLDGVAVAEEQRRAAVVGRVVDVDENWASVQIGLNETVSVGAKARITDEAITASRIAPERVRGLWELRGILRPLLSIGEFGGGVLGELEAGYRMRYFHVGARVTPVGIAAAGGDSVSTWGAYAYGAYDSWIFSAGLGVGAQAVNDTSDVLSDKGSGLSLVQLLRLGAVDGLHLTSRTHAVVFRSQTEFSSLEMQGQISVASGAWLILRGGGGSSGYGFGEVALRNLLVGNGGRGSTFLEVSVGGAGIYEDYCAPPSAVTGFPECSTSVVAGPLVGLGAEWRL